MLKCRSVEPKLFHKTDYGFMVYVNMLTNEQRQHLVNVANKKYGVSFDLEQMVQLVPARMTCETSVFIPDQMASSVGVKSVTQNSKSAPSKESKKAKRRVRSSRKVKGNEDQEEEPFTFAGHVYDFQKFPLRIEFVLPDNGLGASGYHRIIDSLNTVSS